MIRRGLTLIEVLAATVLLSLIAATCLPLMQKATRDLAALHAPPTWDITDLQDLMEEVTEEPLAFGLEDWPPVAANIAWPEGGSRPPVDVRRIHEVSGHVWLEAVCDDHSIFVWVVLPEEPEEAP